MEETSHLVDATCNVTNCSIYYTTTCYNRRGRIYYQCHSGSFLYTWYGPDVNYTKSFDFGYDGEDNHAYYTMCTQNFTIKCDYDDRDIESSLSIYDLTGPVGILMVILFSGIGILIAISVTILMSIIGCNNKKVPEKKLDDIPN